MVGNEDRPLRVVQASNFRGGQSNPYLAQLVDSLPENIECLQFSWRLVLFGSFDIVHVHWPEWMIRRQSRWKSTGRAVLAALMLVRISLTGKAIVRTVHNQVAHEPGRRLESLILAWIDRRTNAAILLNPASPPFGDVPSTLVLHGDYRAWFIGYPVDESMPGRIVNFGLIRPYKGVERLIEAFGGVPDRRASLRIFGRPSSSAIAATVRDASVKDPRVSAFLDFVDDQRLALEISRSDFVALPYAAMQNSGAVLLALSLARPVLVPDNPTTRLLREEVGSDWVWTFSGEIGPADLIEAMRRADARRGLEPGEPDLSRRTWPTLGAQTADVYRAAVAGRR